MRSLRFASAVVAAGLAAGALSSGALAAASESEAPQIAEARATGRAADFMLHYIQEDGPESGHVRVVLTPELRPLTALEARSVAEQAFLRALDEPGLGEGLSRIVVVVRLMPASHPDPEGAERVFRFQHKGGREWGVFLGE